MTKHITIKKIDTFQLSIITSILYFIISLIIVIPKFFWNLFIIENYIKIYVLIYVPFLYLIIGFIFGFIVSLLYNILSKWLGGISMTININDIK